MIRKFIVLAVSMIAVASLWGDSPLLGQFMGQAVRGAHVLGAILGFWIVGGMKK